MNELNVSSERFPTLQELNDIEARKRLPTTIYLCTLMVIGILGNILVLCVFATRYSHNNYRTFTLFLASIDLTACLVYFPAEIVDQTYPYMFFSEGACKGCRFIGRLTILGSALVLIVIAIERHRKVCHPFQTQISHSMAIIMCVFALLLSLCFSWPVILIEGQKVKSFSGNITGYDCGTADSMRGTEYPFIYTIFMFVIFSITFVVIIVLYTLLIQRIKMHSNSMRTKSLDHSKKRRSVTRIMLFISVGYILSFLPHFILEIISTAKKGQVAPPTQIVLATLPLVNRSFLITTVINPFILLIADTSFRKHSISVIVNLLKPFQCLACCNKFLNNKIDTDESLEMGQRRTYCESESKKDDNLRQPEN
ncbi:hypothetical protein KUTeg_011318 [Tegillarca granosa]|uniref:G-protein coupled receptors family 1 profile domain-containing protein n=1 Tax=Tegillarca granosa TaxID=220873 RepID=A0ABQ9F4C4_TEGGR|nr:hypothetical protein KUTeg_011318 [Tegillarca granosa]